jgi:uncharacterized protein (DUF1778 family)
MDHKQLIGFTYAQHFAIKMAAHGAGLSFTAFVRSAAIKAAVEAGIEIQQPKAE